MHASICLFNVCAYLAVLCVHAHIYACSLPCACLYMAVLFCVRAHMWLFLSVCVLICGCSFLYACLYMADLLCACKYLFSSVSMQVFDFSPLCACYYVAVLPSDPCILPPAPVVHAACPLCTLLTEQLWWCTLLYVAGPGWAATLSDGHEPAPVIGAAHNLALSFWPQVLWVCAGKTRRPTWVARWQWAVLPPTQWRWNPWICRSGWQLAATGWWRLMPCPLPLPLPRPTLCLTPWSWHPWAPVTQRCCPWARTARQWAWRHWDRRPLWWLWRWTPRRCTPWSQWVWRRCHWAPMTARRRCTRWPHTVMPTAPRWPPLTTCRRPPQSCPCR